MAINRAGFLARLFARLTGQVPPESGSAAAETPETTAAEAGTPEAPRAEATESPTPETGAPSEIDEQRPEAGPGTDTLSEAGSEPDVSASAGTMPEDGTPGEPGPAPVARDHSVITLVSLAEHAGATTLGAALERRTEGAGWRIRTAGPGLARAAFSGMLADTDALVLVCPADPVHTSALVGKLRWLEANGRPGMPARTLVVINLGTADRGELQLPADLDRPVTLLPFDAALGLPATGTKAPRRAARAAIDHLVDELSTILQEN